MTPNDIKQRVNTIKAIELDCEAAHTHEDRLYLELLQAIANGTCDDPRACAAEAIKSQDVDFIRHAG